MIHQRSSLCFLIVTTIALLFIQTSHVQGSGSIFSGLGYGVIENFGSSRAVALGNAALALPDSLRLNFLNPAHLAQIRQTRISVGGYLSRQWMKDNQASDVDDWSQMEFFGIAISLKKGLALGMLVAPYSRMDYLYGWDGVSSNGIPYHQSYKGSGGLSRIAVNLAWSPKPVVQIGVALSAIWGEVEELRGSYFSTSGYQDIEFIKSRQWRTFAGTLGLAVEPYKTVCLAAIFEPKIPINLNQEFTYTGTDSTVQSEDEFHIAARYGFGMSYRFHPHWLTAFQVLYGDWEKLSELPGVATDYQNSYEVSWGAEWSPGKPNSDSFLRRLSYRWGARWATSYTLSQGSSIDSYFATGGIGIPFHNGKEQLDLSLEYGLRGDLAANGGEEAILKFRLGLNLGEDWFVRTKPSWEE
ncbi:MAG: hypothetical protein ABH878_01735 [bacterium]